MTLILLKIVYLVIGKFNVDYRGSFTPRPHQRRQQVLAYDRIVMLKILKCPVRVVWVFRTIRQLVGHTDIQTTVKYDLRDEKSQKKALRQLQRG